jgi:hypothetical protein
MGLLIKKYQKGGDKDKEYKKLYDEGKIMNTYTDANTGEVTYVAPELNEVTVTAKRPTISDKTSKWMKNLGTVAYMGPQALLETPEPTDEELIEIGRDKYNLENTFLNEAKSPGTLYHYTNEYNIIDILNKGEGLELRKRTASKDIALSLVRPSSIVRDTKMNDLSTEIGNIRIVFDISKASDLIRGFKVKPVAGFQDENTEDLKKIIKSDRKIKYLKKLFLKSGEKETKKILDKDPSLYDKTEDILKILRWISSVAKNREGEERILTKDNKNIPLDSRYIKIELLPGFTKDAIDMEGEYKGYDKQTLKDLIRKKKYKGLFIINNEYRKLMG